MMDFEKLGAFYLGRRYDLGEKSVLDELLLYDSKDLTTHAICVGMTGSGKTGLCVTLIEEAAIDGIPALIIDPKGDLGNMMLTFPRLRPEDFRPWIDESEAGRKGQDPDTYATTVAQTWKAGLAQWGQQPERIARLREAAEITIYTPGSDSGVPLAILRSFEPPPPEIAEDHDARLDRIQAAVSGMLALVGIEADAVRSREHILLANIIDTAWKNGRALDLPGLIREIQKPSFATVGVFDLESFYPSKERFELAVTLNNILASPGFEAWREGDPLDVGRLLYTRDGRPRVAILSIAHLSEAERMFFVTILLNEVQAWMRAQPGTSSLRALLYMDEIFGYFPPSASPPSKKPMLTLLKQARAYGLGVVLATQNPVDLDYKGLSNAGTWFIGRLQTERDKARLLDGLEGVAPSGGRGIDRGEIERILAALGSRVFLMHNVHEAGPQIFHVRWLMSYLRGPLTREQIQTLTRPQKAKRGQEAPPPASAAAPTRRVPPSSAGGEAAAPGESGPAPLPDGVEQYYLAAREEAGAGNRFIYRPALAGSVRLHFVSAKAKLDHWQPLSIVAPAPETKGRVDWDQATIADGKDLELAPGAVDDAEFAAVPPVVHTAAQHAAWRKALVSYLYQNRLLEVWRCAELKAIAKPGETEGEFRGRLQHEAREARDLKLEKLRGKYSRKLETIKDRIQRAEARLERERQQHGQQKLQAAISVGATLVGAFFGRKIGTASVGRATTAMRGMGRVSREKEDIGRAEDAIRTQQAKLEKVESEFQEEIERIEEAMDPGALQLETVGVRPRKSDITVHRFGLAWAPWRVTRDGIAEPLA